MERQRQKLEEWRDRLSTEQHQLSTGRLQVERRCARLRVEAEGLESRVLDNRAVLVHLERQRQSFFSHLREAEPIEAAKAPKEEGLARQPNHGESILPVIEELADQRLALLEQLENLATAQRGGNRSRTILPENWQRLPRNWVNKRKIFNTGSKRSRAKRKNNDKMPNN